MKRKEEIETRYWADFARPDLPEKQQAAMEAAARARRQFYLIHECDFAPYRLNSAHDRVITFQQFAGGVAFTPADPHTGERVKLADVEFIKADAQPQEDFDELVRVVRAGNLNNVHILLGDKTIDRLPQGTLSNRTKVVRGRDVLAGINAGNPGWDRAAFINYPGQSRSVFEAAKREIADAIADRKKREKPFANASRAVVA